MRKLTYTHDASIMIIVPTTIIADTAKTRELIIVSLTLGIKQTCQPWHI